MASSASLSGEGKNARPKLRVQISLSQFYLSVLISAISVLAGLKPSPEKR